MEMETRSRRSQSLSVLESKRMENATEVVIQTNSLEKAEPVYTMMTRSRAAVLKVNSENVVNPTSSGKRKKEKDAVQLQTNKKSAVIGTKDRKGKKATSSAVKVEVLSPTTETATRKRKLTRTARSKKRLLDKQDIPSPVEKRKVVSSVSTRSKRELVNIFSFVSPAKIRRRRRIGPKNAADSFFVQPDFETGSNTEMTEVINHEKDKTSSLQESTNLGTRSTEITNEIAIIARKMYQKVTRQLQHSVYQSDGQSPSHIDLISPCTSTSAINLTISSPEYGTRLCSSTPEQKTPNAESRDKQEKIWNSDAADCNRCHK